ncbi:NEDD8-activating enzyme E1 regulatory subunit-like [Acanthaster planci]|uniref:NEDD8-activating enzyme E1 regulatory subunit n=1 Tax=Acanthaster planci TaxID=133434 RepID=A0A8B7Z5J1_ACAPL|nr:NEDD8-activating enzyme E1 regulatory subunit-like [Acanthaster planci]
MTSKMAAPRGSPVIDKEKKYDRQLRLWGDHGQAALESAHVCLINATATGTEVLKNLILPGIGSFSIVDGNKIKGEDIGNNFFLDKDSLGRSRAQITTELLLELNSDVRGDFVEESPEQLLENNPQYFTSFSIVIATDLVERTLLDLAATLWNAGIPLLVCRSYGFIGYMRLVVKEHTVIESHPDNARDDLRLDCPFPGLVEFADSLDLSQMTKQEHMHTPYLILIYKFLEKWKAEHGSDFPKNYKEKESLRQMIRSGILVNKDGVPEIEENFDEAIKSVNATVLPTRVPSGVQDILRDPSCVNLTSESSSFWVIAQAAKQFVDNEGNGKLPLRGSIPDMTADSKRYIQLQSVYMEQAKQDFAAVASRVHQILVSLGKTPDSIPDMEIKLFCKNTQFLRLVRCRSLAQEYTRDTCSASDIASHLENPDSEVVLYVLLRAADRFYNQYNRFPGSYDDQVEGDTFKLKSCVHNILHEWGVNFTMKDDYINEMCRYGAAELHSVAAFLGGAAAQEVIKIITHQFVPFNNTYIYNGITATSATFQL